MFRLHPSTPEAIEFCRSGCERGDASISQAQSQAAAAHAQVIQAEANALKAQQDLDRYKPLVEKDVISKQQYDAAVATADAAKAAVETRTRTSVLRRMQCV